MTAAPLIISSPAREKQQQQQRRRRRRRQRGRNIAQRCRPDQPTDLSAYLRGREATRSSLTPMRFSVFLKKKKKVFAGRDPQQTQRQNKNAVFFPRCGGGFRASRLFTAKSVRVAPPPPEKTTAAHKEESGMETTKLFGYPARVSSCTNNFEHHHRPCLPPSPRSRA